MDRTTIAIRHDTRARIKAGAAGEAQTIDGFLVTLLDEHEQNRFWASFATVTPESYAAATTSDNDLLDEEYVSEDAALDAEEGV